MVFVKILTIHYARVHSETVYLAWAAEQEGTRPPEKISRGGQRGRFLGEKTSSFNQYRTMLAYI